MSEDVLERAQESEVRLGIVDCDIHPMLRSQDALLPHLSRRWQEELQTNGLRTEESLRRELCRAEGDAGALAARFLAPGRRAARLGPRFHARPAP